jgi:hypothetical protein
LLIGFICPLTFLSVGALYLILLRSTFKVLLTTSACLASTPSYEDWVSVNTWLKWCPSALILRCCSTAKVTCYKRTLQFSLWRLTWACAISCGSNQFLSKTTSIFEVP